MEIIEIPLEQIHMDDDFNCRGRIAPPDVVDLIKDIEKHGLLQPVVVAKYDDAKQSETGFQYRLLAGFRRSTAYKVLAKTNDSFKSIRAVLHAPVSEQEAYILNLNENIQRKQLTVLQEARALAKLERLGVSEHDCAAELGASRGWVQIRYMLLRLPEEIQEEVAAGFISQTQVRELYSVYKTAGKEAAFDATRRIKDAKIKGKGPITVKPIKKRDIYGKKYRTRPEIRFMFDHVYDFAGPGLHTRCLAWCLGEISDYALYQSVKDMCEKRGKIYRMPGA